MAYMGFQSVDDCTAVQISLASSEEIKSWSYGEVKKPETINYRTYRPEKDGLFCERIFGPEKDWECFCGKYRGMKHKGIVCDRCGVKITERRVRRERMGHITLAAPVVHLWFFKTMPSRLGSLLGIKTSALERVIYYQDFVVIEPGDTPLQHLQLLSELEYEKAIEEYGDRFVAGMGADAVRKLIRQLNLDELSVTLRTEYYETSSDQKRKDIMKRLELVDGIRKSEKNPDWMVLDVVPVIPPDLRPLVPLQSGNFATSDLNDLYRRIINRNNRLRKLMELHAPEIIIRNEKRMLQQSVDALFDNSRTKRPVVGSGGLPLKSLTDMIKGKQGRFRENLLGKRVDYSGRSVIVVGPELKLHECGLPKKIALELYQPFVIRRLKELGYAETIKSAKRMLERRDERVWDILEDVIRDHPVLLNRAPTLHRVGIQAFQPVLIEGNAIQIHPLVCRGFNADFDGDQMAVHLPLSLEAQAEAQTLMMSTSNIFSSSSGAPLTAPSQDIVLGIYYLTVLQEGQPGEGKRFWCEDEVLMAYNQKKIGLHTKVSVKITTRPGARDLVKMLEPAKHGYETTAGRVIFNDILPPEMPFYNCQLDQKGLDVIIRDCQKTVGLQGTIELLEKIKTLGFAMATRGGLSFAVTDLRVPPEKEDIIKKTEAEVDKIRKGYSQGLYSDGERYNLIVDKWTHAGNEVASAMVKSLRNDIRDGKRYLNPVFIMMDSGARGSQQQLRQLAGMRGLMAKPGGEIIETPIKGNFREGLSVPEYFSSTHGARKGLADTALKTADSGYLTRKLADVGQNVIISMDDCGTVNGLTKGEIRRGEKVEVTLAENITGRVAADNIVSLVEDEVVVREGEMITEEKARRIEALGFEKIRVRTALTCEAGAGICARCYGMDLARGTMVEVGTAVGIIGAQSIGEPGTQLTLRTFHIGGTASRALEESELRAQRAGTAKFHNVKLVTNREGKNISILRNSEIHIVDGKGRELERLPIHIGGELQVKDGQKVTAKKTLLRWDPHNTPILAERAGIVRFEDMVEGKTYREEIDSVTKVRRKMIMEHKGELHPQIVLDDEEGNILAASPVPEKAFIQVEEGQNVEVGDVLAKTPREITGTQDITGGLPRVTELLEARKPKDPAVISEIDGVVELGEARRDRMSILVRNVSGMEREHYVPRGRYLLVHRGDEVKAGDPLTRGPMVLQDILRIKGDEEVQEYLLREIQGVYRAQNVRIDDKHIEVIISQMMRKVRINDQGESEYLPGMLVDKFIFRNANERLVSEGKRPASASPVLMGITKAALQSDSFLSAASFQETPKVLAEAALAAKEDHLIGLKENVVMGRLVPAGTGLPTYRRSLVARTALQAGDGQESESAKAEA